MRILTEKNHHLSKGISRIFLLVIFSVLILSINSQPLTFKKLVQVLQQSNKSPFVNMLFIYDSATQTGKALQQFIPLITAPKKQYFQVHMLDCNTDDQEVIKSLPYCTKQFRDKLPALSFTQPNLNAINPITKQVQQAKQHQYQGRLQQKALFDFAVPLFKTFSSGLKKVKEWNLFSQNNQKVPTILYFTDKDKLPTIYKILTAHFRNTIAFAHSMKDSPLAQSFNITKYPTMLLNGKQQIILSKNLTEMINKLSQIQGQQTQIVVQQYTSSAEQLSVQNIQKLVYQHPHHTLIHVSDSTGQMHPQWKKCKQSFKKMFTYYETQQLAKQFGVKQTPAIVYFPKSLAKKSVQKTVFSPKDTFRNIYDQISGLVEDFTVPLVNDIQMQKLTSLPLIQGKFIAVLFHQDQISLSYRVLSNDQKYKKDLVFFRMKDPQPTVLEKFKIQKLPALYIMMNEPETDQDKKKQQQKLPQGRVQMNLKMAQFNGRFNYDQLSTYFNMFSKQQKPAGQSQSLNQNNVNLVQINSNKNFKKHCIQQNCYVLLVDRRQSKKQTNTNYQNQVKRFAGKVHQSMVVIDAACHSEVLGPLQIQQQELPTFIYLNSKFQKFSRIIGRIQQKSLNLFISKVKTNKVNYRAYDKISWNDKKVCSQEHKKLDEYEKGSTSEPALDEAEMQILREIQEEQQKKKQQMQKMQKQLEKGQKKRKRRRRPKGQQQSSEL